jgi:hypothetical protein
MREPILGRIALGRPVDGARIRVPVSLAVRDAEPITPLQLS